MPDLIDEFTVRKFLTLLHSRAAAALSHVRRPGVLQLVSIAPDDRGMSISPFAIGFAVCDRRYRFHGRSGADQRQGE